MRSILFLIGLLVCLSGIFLSAQTDPTSAFTMRHGPANEWDLREVGSTSMLSDLINTWFIVIGASIMAITLLRWPSADRFPDRSLPRIFPDLPLRNVFPWRRHRPLPLFCQPVNFGLYFGALLWILIFIFMVLRTPQRLYGLPISFPPQPSSTATDSPWPKAPAVYIDDGGNFSLNGIPILRHNLGARLQQELARRAVWTIYFEADNNSSYRDAVFAIDTIQGLGAHVIWLTPKLRQQLTPARTPPVP
jgi:biopolymer transport protein ExbD